MKPLAQDFPAERGAIWPMLGRSQDHFGCAVGHIRAQFPSLSVEREFFQSLNSVPGPTGVSTQRPKPGLTSGATPPAGSAAQAFDIHSDDELTRLNTSDRNSNLIYQQLTLPGMRYLAREMCWTLIGQDGGPLANLIPTGNRDLGNLIAALAPTSTNSATSPNPSAPAQYLVYGHWVRGAIQGLCQQAERSLTPERLLQAPSPALLTQLMRGLSSGASAAMQQIVEQLQSLLANCGLSDDERALNFLLLTRPEPYTLSFSQLWNSASDGPNPAGYQLIGVRTEAARCANRPQIKVILEFTGINTGAPLSWYFVVDTAGEFPFLPAPPEARRYLKSTFA